MKKKQKGYKINLQRPPRKNKKGKRKKKKKIAER